MLRRSIMLRRWCSSVPKFVPNCSDCRLYNQTTKLCKINKLNAFENRLDDGGCGRNGNNFWSLDKTHLIQSEEYDKYQGLFGLLAILSVPSAIIFHNYNFIFSSIIALYAAEICSDLSDKYKQKFLDVNNIDDNDKRTS